MSTLRASYTIDEEVLSLFNKLIPAGERSRAIQELMKGLLPKQEKKLEAVAREFATHPDFAQARADSLMWDATVSDGLGEQAL